MEYKIILIIIILFLISNNNIIEFFNSSNFCDSCIKNYENNCPDYNDCLDECSGIVDGINLRNDYYDVYLSNFCGYIK